MVPCGTVGLQTCSVPMTGTRMEVCFILTSLASRGSPPAFLMQYLFFLDFERDQRAKALPRTTRSDTGRWLSSALSMSGGS